MNIDQQLHELADRIVPPDVSVFEDLTRGRRRVRRHRAGVAASAATVLVLGGVAWLAVPTDLPDGGPAGDPTSAAPEPEPTPSDRELPLVPPSTEPAWQPANIATLQAWRDVLAEHLDPDGTHLEKRPSNEQSGGGEGSQSLGTKLAWTVPGQDGMGVVQISVASAADATYSMCGEGGWTCRDATAPGGLPARVGSGSDGTREVTVTHADGHLVMLTVNALFGNNSTVPVDGIELSDEQLLAAAADDRLALPAEVGQEDHGLPADLPPRLLLSLGEELALSDGLRFRPDEGAGGGYVYGTVVSEGQPRGHLMLQASRAAGARARVCQDDVYVRCLERTVDGRTVFIGWIDPSVNDGSGGWNVAYAGPVHKILVGFFPREGGTLSLDGAVELVLDPALQAAR